MLSDEEKREYEELKSLLYIGTISQYGKRKLIDMFEKQSKEIEELKEDKYGLEEEVQIQAKNIMLCENALCEIQDKIKAKIEEIDEKLEYETNGWESEYEYCKEFLQSLLEKE